MIYALSVFTLLMSGSLLLMRRRVSKALHKQVLSLYAFLFGFCSIGMAAVLVYQHRELLPVAAEWLHSQQKTAEWSVPDEQQLFLSSTLFPLLKGTEIQPEVRLEAVTIRQYPELPRGCEVTSLAMLLHFHGVDVSKTELADKIKKDPTPYRQTADGIYFGNPHNGFVGEMTTLDEPGYGVYHGPVADLAEEYLGNRVRDLSGSPFSFIIRQLNAARPVWVITNTTYRKLPENKFQTWNTPDGPVEITRKEHAVLLTGYDMEAVYFNDPLTGKEKKAPKAAFEAAWVQMGKQAITVVP